MSQRGTSMKRAQHALLPILLIALIAFVFRSIGMVDPAANAQPGISAESIDESSETIDADRTILWVGNSHVQSHDLPDLVANLIRFRKPDEKVAHRAITIAFLEGEEKRIKKRLDSKDWDHVILQAQKISASGRVRYSTSDGVSLAKHALSKGSRTYFYSEWGLRGDANNAAHTALVYREMAQESGAELISVGEVWNRVLQQAPGLELYAPDGNHQSRLGASLTALVITCALLEAPASEFLEYSDSVASREQWGLFCRAIDHATSPNISN